MAGRRGVAWRAFRENFAAVSSEFRGSSVLRCDACAGIIGSVKGVWSRALPGVTFQTTPPLERPLDGALGALAARQHGLVTARQLRSAGLGDSAVRRRVRAGRLHRIHRGVYAVGHPALSLKGRWLAAVMACGPGALLSHFSAAALWALRQTGRVHVDVTSPTGAGRGLQGIDVHRSRTLLPSDGTTLDGIPVT
ncbi:MAG: type IV toxin-antitoxin system AbiEi family antitoxin domain-containing protein, partial [Solirubrobacteraceae bacterium]